LAIYFDPKEASVQKTFVSLETSMFYHPAGTLAEQPVEVPGADMRGEKFTIIPSRGT
jgi:hypothetical protein